MKVDYQLTRYPELDDFERELYWEYKNELWKIGGEHAWSREAVDGWYSDIIQNEDLFVVRVLVDSIQAGFIFIAVNVDCHPDADYYVQDCYISPEFRRNHLMQTAFQMFVYAHHGTYCLYLIDSNQTAIGFWGRQFDIISYKEVPIDDYSDIGTDLCHLHAYRRV